MTVPEPTQITFNFSCVIRLFLIKKNYSRWDVWSLDDLVNIFCIFKVMRLQMCSFKILFLYGQYCSSCPQVWGKMRWCGISKLANPVLISSLGWAFFPWKHDYYVGPVTVPEAWWSISHLSPFGDRSKVVFPLKRNRRARVIKEKKKTRFMEGVGEKILYMVRGRNSLSLSSLSFIVIFVSVCLSCA